MAERRWQVVFNNLTVDHIQISQMDGPPSHPTARIAIPHSQNPDTTIHIELANLNRAQKPFPLVFIDDMASARFDLSIKTPLWTIENLLTGQEFADNANNDIHCFLNSLYSFIQGTLPEVRKMHYYQAEVAINTISDFIKRHIDPKLLFVNQRDLEYPRLGIWDEKLAMEQMIPLRMRLGGLGKIISPSIMGLSTNCAWELLSKLFAPDTDPREEADLAYILFPLHHEKVLFIKACLTNRGSLNMDEVRKWNAEISPEARDDKEEMRLFETQLKVVLESLSYNPSHAIDLPENMLEDSVMEAFLKRLDPANPELLETLPLADNWRLEHHLALLARGGLEIPIQNYAMTPSRSRGASRPRDRSRNQNGRYPYEPRKSNGFRQNGRRFDYDTRPKEQMERERSNGMRPNGRRVSDTRVDHERQKDHVERERLREQRQREREREREESSKQQEREKEQREREMERELREKERKETLKM